MSTINHALFQIRPHFVSPAGHPIPVPLRFTVLRNELPRRRPLANQSVSITEISHQRAVVVLRPSNSTLSKLGDWLAIQAQIGPDAETETVPLPTVASKTNQPP